jgi:hypothetical protein
VPQCTSHKPAQPFVITLAPEHHVSLILNQFTIYLRHCCTYIHTDGKPNNAKIQSPGCTTLNILSTLFKLYENFVHTTRPTCRRSISTHQNLSYFPWCSYCDAKTGFLTIKPINARATSAAANTVVSPTVSYTGATSTEEVIST